MEIIAKVCGENTPFSGMWNAKGINVCFFPRMPNLTWAFLLYPVKSNLLGGWAFIPSGF
jgi:hypothetical protein